MNWNEIDKKAASITIGAHLLLLLLFMLIGYTLPASNTNTDEFGVEVNLGNSDDGSGNDQPFRTGKPEFQPEENHHSARQTASTGATNDMLADPKDDEAASINHQRNVQAVRPGSEINKNTARNQPKPKSLFPGNTSENGNGADRNENGGNEGIGKGNGDMGVVGGTAGSKNYTGTPGNGGVGHSFTDRDMIARPRPDADFKEGGRVVIRVTVNRAGTIVNKRVKSATNAELAAKALEKTNEIRFSKSETAPPEQFGDITFVFKTRTIK